MKKGLAMILVLAMLLSMMIGGAAAEGVTITGAGCSPSAVGMGENLLLFVWTSLETRSIALFDEAGNQLRKWSSDAHSVQDGQMRVWNVIVQADTLGANTALVKASADGVNYEKEYKISFTLTEDAPERISSGAAEISNVTKFLSRNIEPYEPFFVDVYTSDNAKLLSLLGENGEVLQSWIAEESARYPKAGQCIWTVMLRPSASGEVRCSFSASEDGERYGNTMSMTVTVNALESSIYCDYIGKWYGVSMSEGSESYTFAELGMEMTLEINADGSVRMDMAGEVDEALWQSDNGRIIIAGAPLTLDGDTLTMDDYGSKIVFSREAPAEALAEEEPIDEPTTGMPNPAAFPEYLGEWYCISMTEGGETASPADLGMEITLTLNDDAYAVFDMAGEVENTGWSVIGNGISVMGLRGTLQDDGTLVLEGDGTELVFSRERIKGRQADGSVDMSAFADFIGTWVSEADGMSVSIFEDGAASVEVNGEITNASLSEDFGYLYFKDVMLRMQYDGKLLWSAPDTDVFLTRADAAMPEPVPEPVPEPMPESVSIEERMDKRYVCVGADMDGYRLDASILGGEYAMTFHANGRMELVMAGMEVPGGLAWEAATVMDEDGREQKAFQIDYFGTVLTAVLTDTGFDMNYMDTMLMHFE